MNANICAYRLNLLWVSVQKMMLGGGGGVVFGSLQLFTPEEANDVCEQL